MKIKGILFLYTAIQITCCQTNYNKNTANQIKHITKTSVDIFKINTNINDYNLSGFIKSTDTSAYFSEEDTVETLGKKITFNDNNSICLWLWNDTIKEILIKSEAFSTSDNIRKGLPFEQFFNIIKSEKYILETEWGMSYFLPKRKLVIGISNSNLEEFTENEIIDLNNNVLSINKEKLNQMSIEYIRLIDFR